ncbi:MAG TPA: tetratricopeptide repeat-containing protein [Gemmataceae bacterium]|jgi:tetratricopeptide (TPR) repeat protein|nr:tetratricopeptide repeat-containing protein [Gemmataceae bacterium]
MTHLSHHAELDAIRRLWRKSNQAEDLVQAKERLCALRREFLYVLAVGHELVLVLEKLGDVDGAVRALGELERQFKQLDEEMLCRWGKIFKKKGDTALSVRADVTQALHDFAQAGKYYARAHEIHRGFYPRINELTLQFLQAALQKDLEQHEESQRLLDDVRRKAQQMLADATVWRSRKDDDHVWLPATKGEAHVLAGDWRQASDRYLDALAAARGQQFYADCMRDQLKMLLDACRRLGLVTEGGLADPDKFFTVPMSSETAGD